MANLENLLWAVGGAVLGTVLSAIVIGTWNWIVAKRDDKVRLKATVSQPGDLGIIEKIGCACMIVTVKSTGKRVAKIGGAVVVLQGVVTSINFQYHPL